MLTRSRSRPNLWERSQNSRDFIHFRKVNFMRLLLPGRKRPWRQGLVAAFSAAALGAALLTTGGAAPAQAADPTTVDVTVNANEGQGTIPDTAYGLNSAVWDAEMNSSQTQDLLKDADIGMLRYPGGSYGDIYHWQTNTAPGGYVAPGTDFDSFMGTVQKIGAQPILIADYGSATPEEAADWVRYANVTKGYDAKYWEIGNELYGNGHYGDGWETDQHDDKSPAAYAHNMVDYVTAMKAVDPTDQDRCGPDHCPATTPTVCSAARTARTGTTR